MKNKKLNFFKYYGGKYFMVDTILKLIGDCHTYIEPFGGSGKVLLNKKPSPIEIYNDINEYVVNLFRVIRDDDKYEQFLKKLENTPYSRVEYNNFKNKFKNKQFSDEVDKAFCYYYLIICSYCGCQTGFSTSRFRNTAVTYDNKLSELSAIKKRLHRVVIECLDFREIFMKYDHEGALFYCDPPYPQSVRVASNVYMNEMTDKDHYDLIDLCSKVKGRVILSSYKNDIYDRLLADKRWQRFDYNCAKYSTKLKDKLKRNIVTESLYINFQPDSNIEKLPLSAKL